MSILNNPDSNHHLSISVDMLETILAASLQTARSHYGRPEEMYALGQLESTANMMYVMLCSQVAGEYHHLETLCQEYANIAVERMEELSLQMSEHGKVAGFSKVYSISKT